MNLDEDIRIETNAQGEETYIFDPYNPLNKLIGDEDILNILRKYNIDVPIYN